MGFQFPEGVLVYLGKIAWGCQISWGGKFPVTPGLLITSQARTLTTEPQGLWHWSGGYMAYIPIDATLHWFASYSIQYFGTYYTELTWRKIAWTESEESNHIGYGQARSESEVHRMGVIFWPNLSVCE